MTETIDAYEVYERIFTNRPYGKNLKIYSKDIMKIVIELLSDYEEYEMCIELDKYLESRFDHNKGYKDFKMF
jgi:hypothetical protein